MLKVTKLVLALLLTSTAYAQWGPPGGQGGGHNQRPATTSKPLNLDTAPKGNSKISGSLVDDALSTPVDYATVALIDIKTGKSIDGTIADENGKFELKKVAEGTYNLVITFVGYETLKIEKIKVEKGKDTDLGVLKMKSSAVALEGVVITGEKALIEEKVDRLVYNAEKDLTASGGDASDVLKNVPMLNVDLDGNVSLRGSENIQVLINNKPSTIVASSIADALKMIPADLIKSVEVITSPSAKYDAEGTAGIINIITKKSNLQGLNLNLNGGIGNRGSNIGFNGNYRTGKLGITFGGFGRLGYNKSRSESTNQNLMSGLVTNQFSEGKTNMNFGRYNLGFDYDLGHGQSLMAGVAIGNRAFNRYNDQNLDYYQNSSLLRKEIRDQEALNTGLSFDYNIDYLKVFNPGKELSLSAYYSTSDAKTDTYINYLDGLNNSITKKQWNDNDNKDSRTSFQADFLNSIGTNQQIEVGAKAQLSKINSGYMYYISDSTSLSQDLDDFDLKRLIQDPRNPGGGLAYDQNIYSAYASYTYSTANKFTFKVGGRYEYTTISSSQEIKQAGADAPVFQSFTDEYPVFVPSFNISKPFGQLTTKLSYNYRISRPGMRQLNPNIDIADPLNVNMGNSMLDPGKTHNFELSFSRPVNRSYFTLSGFGRYTDNNITRVSMTAQGAATRFPNIPELQNLDPSAIVTTFDNVGKESTVGGNFYANIYVSPALNFTANFDMYYINIQGKEFVGNSMRDRTTDGTVTSARGSANLKLPANWSIQLNGGYRGKMITLQGEMRGMTNYSVAVKKDFTKSFSLGLGADNFFGGMKMVNNSSTSQFISRNTNYLYNQNVKLTFTYKIGNMKFVQSKKKNNEPDDMEGNEF